MAVQDPSSAYSSPNINSNGTLSSVAQPAPYSPSLQPSLIRSSQVLPVAPALNPYVMSGGAKATLELTGDLTAMSKGWSQEEWHSRRRLVQFWRRQDGTTIFAAFRPLSQADYPQAQNSIIISCIFREDKNVCFVTSVDAIYLLEALVGTRFTVEEKNRIRRNLERFRPITVSKAKPGSEGFFKLIMGFPNPKPRNIEKDVKVFPWDILGAALKKIIGKYVSSLRFKEVVTDWISPRATRIRATVSCHLPNPVNNNPTTRSRQRQCHLSPHQARAATATSDRPVLHLHYNHTPAQTPRYTPNLPRFRIMVRKHHISHTWIRRITTGPHRHHTMRSTRRLLTSRPPIRVRTDRRMGRDIHTGLAKSIRPSAVRWLPQHTGICRPRWDTKINRIDCPMSTRTFRGCRARMISRSCIQV
jgi:hypothetical protein